MSTEFIEKQDGSFPPLSGGIPPERGGKLAPEVCEVAKRRTFTREYKLKILKEYDRLPQGEKGLLLRREGIFLASIIQWRKKFVTMKNNKSKSQSPSKVWHNEKAKLERKVKSLELKLKKAEAVIEFQKKISEMLQLDEEESKTS